MTVPRLSTSRMPTLDPFSLPTREPGLTWVLKLHFFPFLPNLPLPFQSSGAHQRACFPHHLWEGRLRLQGYLRASPAHPLEGSTFASSLFLWSSWGHFWRCRLRTPVCRRPSSALSTSLSPPPTSLTATTVLVRVSSWNLLYCLEFLIINR